MNTFVPDTQFIIELIIASLAVTAMISLVIYFSGITRLFERRRAFIGKWMGGNIDKITKKISGGTFQVIEVQKVTGLTDKLIVRKGNKSTTIAFDSGQPTFRTKKNTWIYMVDIEQAQVLLNPEKFKVPNWVYDEFLTRGTLRNVMAGVSKSSLMNSIPFILLGFLAAIPLGIMIGKLLL